MNIAKLEAELLTAHRSGDIGMETVRGILRADSIRMDFSLLLGSLSEEQRLGFFRAADAPTAGDVVQYVREQMNAEASLAPSSAGASGAWGF